MDFTICIIFRILLALCAKYVNDDTLQKMGYILLVPSFFFIYLYLFDKRKILMDDWAAFVTSKIISETIEQTP